MHKHRFAMQADLDGCESKRGDGTPPSEPKRAPTNATDLAWTRSELVSGAPVTKPTSASMAQEVV